MNYRLVAFTELSESTSVRLRSLAKDAYLGYGCVVAAGAATEKSSSRPDSSSPALLFEPSSAVVPVGGQREHSCLSGSQTEHIKVATSLDQEDYQ